MAGLDAVTEFRVQRIPVGGGLVLTASQAVADGVAGLGQKFLGRQVGTAASALTQVAAAWAARLPMVEQFVGRSTADLLGMVMVAAALDGMLGIRNTVRGLLASAGVPVLSAGRPATAIAQAPAGAQRVFRTDVSRKAGLTRL